MYTVITAPPFSPLAAIDAKANQFFPFAVVLIGSIALIWLFSRASTSIEKKRPSFRFAAQIITLVFSLIALISSILVLPISDGLRGQLLGLVGVVLSATLALSSTTVVGNMMAGVMLRMMRSFRGGDFIHVGDVFGRVARMGLLRTEIQTEDRNLITYPNLHMVTHPIKIVPSDGTIIHTDLSLGYDVSRHDVEKELLKAAEEVGLQNAFVHIQQLGDFSISYRLSGLLQDLSSILSTRAHLRAAIIDALHEAKIEIVSPNFMNTRAFEPHKLFVPEPAQMTPATADNRAEQAEAIVFDKGEKAAKIEELKDAKQALAQRTEEGIDKSDIAAEQEALDEQIKQLEDTKEQK